MLGDEGFEFPESPWGYSFGDLLEGPRSLRILDCVERSLWLDLWHAPVLDAVVEERVERRWQGPIQATVVGAEPELSQLNLLLGAADPGAVSEGHLERSLEWVDSLGLGCSVPLDPEREEVEAAEQVLTEWGFGLTASLLRLRREDSPPELPAPPGIEVIELKEFSEGFGDLLAEGYGLGTAMGWLFDCLPGRYPWRCYLALDEHGYPAGAAATMAGELATHMGFAATAEPARGQGVHSALIHRVLSDGAGRFQAFVAETTEPIDEKDPPSVGCRNLLRAGFRQVSVRALWQRPAESELD